MTPDASDIETIEDLNNQFTGALGNGDVSAVATMFTESAVILPPRRNTIKDEGIQRYFLFLAQQAHNIKLMASDMDMLGPDIVREIGMISFRTRGETAERVTGRYFFLWQRVEGSWKINTFFWTRNVEGNRPPGRRVGSGV